MRTKLFSPPVKWDKRTVLFMEEAAPNAVYLTMIGGEIKTFQVQYQRNPLFDLMLKKLNVCGQ